MKKTDLKKYLFAFIITAAIFLTATLLSGYFNSKKIDELRSIEDTISLDILSTETQFQLLEEASCEDISNSFLSQELGTLGERLSHTEDRRGSDKEITDLKRYYSLLLIKDYLLMKQVSEKCDFDPVFILYFYSNEGDCPDCIREGHVLTRLREEYPQLRIYAFDYNLDLSALRTLISIRAVENNLPALVIDDTVYYGFQGIRDIETIIPDLVDLREEGSATSTDPLPESSAE